MNHNQGRQLSLQQKGICVPTATPAHKFPRLKTNEQAVVEIPPFVSLSTSAAVVLLSPGILAALKQLSQCRSLAGMARPTRVLLTLPATEIGHFNFAQRGLYYFGLALCRNLLTNHLSRLILEVLERYCYASTHYREGFHRHAFLTRACFIY